MMNAADDGHTPGRCLWKLSIAVLPFALLVHGVLWGHPVVGMCLSGPEQDSPQKITVAVIGCGPGGMSFCHAIETMRQKGTLVHDVSVTCFERASQPGGVWRPIDENDPSTSTNMYAALWTNGASHAMEFFDYTFDEHFKEPVPVYLPRRDFLGYMKARVQKRCPNFFDKYAEFNTEVVRSEYNNSNGMFDVTLMNTKTHILSTRKFDKVIFAGGPHGSRKMPKSLVDIFQSGGFKGRVIHSTDTANLEDDVRGKRILLVGGGYSAEDLALQTIKLGVQKVYISSRGANCVNWHGAWPQDKVEVLNEQVPFRVTQSGRCIQLNQVEYSCSVGDYQVKPEELPTELCDIDTVIFCTGYQVNMDMFEESLKKVSRDFPIQLPDNWEMAPNLLSNLTGHVKPGPNLQQYSWSQVKPDYYRGVLISNPNMMKVDALLSNLPMLATDAAAWLLAGFVSGAVELPSREEMKARNREQLLLEMSMPSARDYMDPEYCQIIENLDKDESLKDLVEELYGKSYNQYNMYTYKVLARVMEEGKYGVSFGSFEELNEKAQVMLDFGTLSYYHRVNLTANSSDSNWRTFRDYDNPESFYSMFTNTTAAPMKQRWMDMDV